jgi:hypothetical protein
MIFPIAFNVVFAYLMFAKKKKILSGIFTAGVVDLLFLYPLSPTRHARMCNM